MTISLKLNGILFIIMQSFYSLLFVVTLLYKTAWNVENCGKLHKWTSGLKKMYYILNYIMFKPLALCK